MDQNDESDDAVCGGAEDGGKGAELGGALGDWWHLPVGKPPHAVDEEADDARQDKGDDEDDDQLGEVGMDKAEHIVVPVVHGRR